jgi:pimeloyl-ACP methyl ester carboxylesterase
MAAISKKKIIIVAAAILITAPIIAYIAAGRDTRGLINYYAWKTFSKESGKGRRVPINDITLYYEVHGSGKPLLLMHGGLVFIESFYNQIPALAKEFMVIAPDSRAHGRSTDSAQPLSYSLMAKDMAALLEKLKLKNVAVVGWSDGGIIGLDLAMNHPELVNKLVVIGTNYNTGGMTKESIDLTKKMSADTAEFKPARDFYKRIAPDPGHWPAFVDKIKTMWLTQPNYTPADLKKITAPTLIILGEKDMIRKDHGEEMRRNIPGSRLLIINGASHFVGMEKPDELNRAIIDFLN